MDVSTDKARLDIDFIHRFLSEESTWAKGIPRALVEKSIAHSLCFGLYDGGAQVGFARVISDYATFAYLVDVFVPEALRGRGFSRALMDAVMAHPELQGLRRFLLATSTAGWLYEKYGFTLAAKPQAFMEINTGGYLSKP